MRTIVPPTERSVTKTSEHDEKENSIYQNSELSGMSVLSEQVYHEMADEPVTRIDPWQQLQLNIDTLQDLQSRYSFVLREVRYLIKA